MAFGISYEPLAHAALGLSQTEGVGLPFTNRKLLAELERQATQLQLQIPFPDWVEHVRAAPNSLLRSALFGVSRRGKRQYVKQLPLPMVGELSLTYTGELLDQADLDIVLQILHYSRRRCVIDAIEFSTRRLLLDIGRSVGKSDYMWLRGRLDALTSCGITISKPPGKRIYSGPILTGVQNDVIDRSAFNLNRFLRALFERDMYTELNWSDRLALGPKQLAKWLLSFYSTHAAPYPMKVSTIKELCRSQAGDLNFFRRDLRKALAELEARLLIHSWQIDGTDKLHIRRPPSPSQARHLARKHTG